MAGNTFGRMFSLTTFGESHGVALGCVVDGCPPGLFLKEEDIQKKLNRRKPGTSRFVTQRKEADRVQILSGVFEGKTTGTPIALVIFNEDMKSHDYDSLKDVFRPGHADFSYLKKFGIRDYRGGGRASARETAARVAAGAIAQKWLLENFNIQIRAYLHSMGSFQIPFVDEKMADENAFFAPNLDVVPQLETYLDSVRKSKDSIGAMLNLVARNVPAGLGSPVFEKLDALIAFALMSIPAVKAIEIGEGIAAASLMGSENNDQMQGGKFLTNHAGGILGGISTGEELHVRLHLKPTPSIALPQKTMNVAGEDITLSIGGRHDPCVGIRAVPIAEAMLALVLIDQILIQRAQCGDFPR